MSDTKNKLSFRYTIVAMLLFFVITATFCGNGDSIRSENTFKYSIIKTEDVSSRDAKRLRVRTLVDTLLNKIQVTAICNDIIKKNSYKEKGYKAVQFLFYLPDTDINGQFTCAMADWAPNGVWAEAAKMKNENHKMYKLKIELAEKAEWTDKTGLSIKKKREVFYKLVVVEDSLFNVGETSVSEKSHKIIAKRFNLSLNDVDEIAKEGLLKSWPIP